MTQNNDRNGVFLKWAPVAVLVAGLIVTALIWNVMQQQALRELRGEFDEDVRALNTRIDERLDDYRDILSGAAGLFRASHSVERKEFHDYVANLHLENTYPGIQGVGFSLLVPARDKARVTDSMRREGFPQFSIKPDGKRDPYSAIVYLEPFDWRNQRAFGYDMYSEPVRREAMERARDNGMTALSGRVTLVQETTADVQSGFLMYMPVYRNDLRPDTLEERRRALVGWVYEPFRMNNLMKMGVLGRYMEQFTDELDIEIYDGDGAAGQNILFDSALARQGGQALFEATHTTEHFGRNWTVTVHSMPTFEAKLRQAQARIVAVGGILITLLLTLLVRQMATTNARATKLAAKMSEKLEHTLVQTITAMATVIELRDPYTAGHQRRAASLAQAIALEMGWSGEQLTVLKLAALVYEIGKIQIPAEILSKPGRLDETEYSLVKVHPQAGFDILREIEFPWPIAQIVQQHHERLDGSGYPAGLKGDEIMLEARIIAVADVVEAMFSHRPYRPAQDAEKVLSEIITKRGTLYDADVVDACVRLFRVRGYRLPD